MNVDNELGFWRHREEILKQLRKWGYDPDRIAVDDLSVEGYWRFLYDEHGARMMRNRQLAREFVPWKKKRHWEWLEDTIKGRK